MEAIGSGLILYGTDGGTATVVLNRPEHHEEPVQAREAPSHGPTRAAAASCYPKRWASRRTEST